MSQGTLLGITDLEGDLGLGFSRRRDDRRGRGIDVQLGLGWGAAFGHLLRSALGRADRLGARSSRCAAAAAAGIAARIAAIVLVAVEQAA